ncbi:MAG: sulfite exporter TauE/SafE family protein [Burkholderiales bacterium]
MTFPIITDPLFYAVAIPAVILVGIAKGGFPGAFGGMAVPLMSLAISPITAAGIMLPILCLMDLIGLWAYRGIWDRTRMNTMIVGAVLGVTLGGLMFGHLDEQAIRFMVGSIAVLFALNHWLGFAARQYAGDETTAKSVFWCGLSGFTSTVAHAGGPPLMVYMLPLKMEKTLLVGTTVIFFTAVNYFKLIPYALLGQLNLANVSTSLVLSPLAPLGIGLGVWLHRRVKEKVFYRISYTLLFLMGAKLIYDGISHWH